MININLGVFKDALSIARARRMTHFLNTQGEDIRIAHTVLPALDDSDDYGVIPATALQNRVSEYVKYIKNETIDAFILDAHEYERYCCSCIGINIVKEDIFFTETLEKEIAAPIFMRRGDPRYVLIERKDCNTRIFDYEPKRELKVITADKNLIIQLNNLYDNIKIECVNTSYKDIMERLIAGACNAAVIPADEMKLLKYGKDDRFNYHYMSCTQLVPYMGKAILCIFCKRGSAVEKKLKEISSIWSEKEIQLEHMIAKKVDEKSKNKPDEYNISVRMKGNIISIFGGASVEDTFIRMHETGEIADSLCLVNRFAEKMNKKVKY